MVKEIEVSFFLVGVERIPIGIEVRPFGVEGFLKGGGVEMG